jgi:putative oxidoreductase
VPLAFYLPWLEIIGGLALIFRRLYSGALTLILALMLVFIGGSIAAKARGIDITCGCFGHVSDKLSFSWHMALDFAILAALIALWRWDAGKPRLPEQTSP